VTANGHVMEGDGVAIDDGVILGYAGGGRASQGLVIGAGSRLRTGTVLYAGSAFGCRFETGHNVVVREDNVVGDDVSIWSNAFVDYGCAIGDRVKIHVGCYVAQFSCIGDGAFLAPGVVFANDLFPGDAVSADAMRGPTIGMGVQIGVNVTIVPYVSIGAGSIVGAGSVVTKDIPEGMLAYGCPARVVGPVSDIDIASRVRLRAGRSPETNDRPPLRGVDDAGGTEAR